MLNKYTFDALKHKGVVMNRAHKITFIFLIFFQQIFTNQEVQLEQLPTTFPTILLSNRAAEGFISGTMVLTEY